MLHTLLPLLAFVVVAGWILFFTTSPKMLAHVHKIVGGAPLYLSHEFCVQVGSFQMHGGFAIGKPTSITLCRLMR